MILTEQQRGDRVMPARPSLLRRALSGMLLLALLAISNAPLMALLRDTSSSCGTKCCRARKSCCCRKRADGPASGAMSISARTCPSGCGKTAALPGAAAAVQPRGSTPILPGIRASKVMAASMPAAHGCPLAYVLFQRPPPGRLIAN